MATHIHFIRGSRWSGLDPADCQSPYLNRKGWLLEIRCAAGKMIIGARGKRKVGLGELCRQMRPPKHNEERSPHDANQSEEMSGSAENEGHFRAQGGNEEGSDDERLLDKSVATHSGVQVALTTQQDPGEDQC